MMKEMYLQYISQGETPKEHLDNIEQVCKAGGKWIQLRIKDQDMATYLDTAIKCRNICDQYNAIMIINDNIGVAKAALADGVHLGLQDMDTREARKILGDNFIIGATANTLQDCKKHREDEVDYIGLGPYRHTTTKKKLSPVLGIKGYEEILSKFRIQNIKMPVVAIGGITEQDIIALMQTGISGIAVSGLLTNKENIKEKIKNIKEQIENKFSSK
ncbi:thiamine phosphate synthase [Aquimarina muelleri]|uniref:Thiamine-phosphate synthase n=1 Tax=Aquimarina muelleri TaxID=279356 RepID=A0A918N228_9FLAO|nr:thiamine phosphate synthase [Aquimarina muelleri]MCX2764262.1 thiamine phosphate synthase [Aquimarina muelleri]GGX08022.1 thiamine-phosphate synthase [Aquimarina muelleri]